MKSMTTQYVEDYWKDKIGGDCVVCTFYDLRIAHNLSESEVDEFLQLSRKKLENNGYDVYFTGAKYKYHGVEKVVETNQYIVAIKDGAKN